MKVAALVTVLMLGSSSAFSASPSGVLGAVVDSSGRKIAGTAVQVQYNFELGGTYYVFFRRAVIGCVATVSVTGTGSTPQETPAIATVAPANNAPTAIAVQIRDVAGKLVRRGFNLAVNCL